MIPGAGLYLPNTLHRKDEAPLAHSERKEKSLKYFQSNSQKRARDQRTSEDQTSTNSSRKSSTDNTASSVQSPATNLNFVDTGPSEISSAAIKPADEFIEPIRRDISEASWLYTSPAVSNFLNVWPDKRTWVDQTLSAARDALNDIGVDIGTAQQGLGHSGKISSRRRFEWIRSHQGRDSKKQQHLRKCHHELAGAIHIMQTIELCGLASGTSENRIFEAPAQPRVAVHEKDALVPAKDKFASRSTLSDVEMKYSGAIQRNSEPAELPGSMPRDKASPTSPSLYSLPDIILPDDISFGRPSALRRSLARSTRRPTAKQKSPPIQLPHIKNQSPLIEEFLEWASLSPINEQLSSDEWESSPVHASGGYLPSKSHPSSSSETP